MFSFYHNNSVNSPFSFQFTEKSSDKYFGIGCIKKCRCDERLQTKTKEFTRLPYTAFASSIHNKQHQQFEGPSGEGTVCRDLLLITSRGEKNTVFHSPFLFSTANKHYRPTRPQSTPEQTQEKTLIIRVARMYGWAYSWSPPSTARRSRTRRTYRAPVDRSISLRHLHALVSIRTAPTLPRGCEGNRSLTPVRTPSRASVPHSPPCRQVDHLPSNSPTSFFFFPLSKDSGQG
jgi:hypothetical protein